MKLSRYISENLIKLEMSTQVEPFENGDSHDRWLQQGKEKILVELVDLLCADNRVGNRSKLLTDFINRERKATTAIGRGIAIPHIRSLQAKEFMIAFARSTSGYNFDSPDKQPSHLFFVMAAPPYDDVLYLRAFKALAEMMQYETFRDELLNATQTGEIIRSIRSME
ncbi:MAG: PTS sugar transporter subunit IIA [candidate division Zixibacteria bacterium]